jgi:elongation factor P
MDTDTYDQIELPAEFLEERAAFLQEGMKVTVESHEGKPIGVAIPEQVTLGVVEADPVVKGQTAASSYKPGKLDNGMRILIPPHIEAGTRVVVNTADGSYVERAK